VQHVGNPDEGDAAFARPNRFLLPTEVRQREPEKDVALRIIGRCAELLLESLPGLLGVGVSSGRRQGRDPRASADR
jgi:hypothetical protein